MGFWFHLVHSVLFSSMMRPSVKARVCEDMSMPVVRGFFIQGNIFVAHRHSYAIVEPFMDHQLNGAHSQAVQLAHFFHPWNIVVSSLELISVLYCQ
jgi:hypothetical protein